MVAMKSMKQAWLDRDQVEINGHAWTPYDMSPGCTEIVLIRSVRVRPHQRRIGDYRASSWRTISLRRPVDTEVAIVAS